MFDRGDLRAAVEAGALSDEAARRFEAFLKTRSDPDKMLDPENLRFLANFNDIFLAIGMAILVAGVAVASGMMLGDGLLTGNTRAAAIIPVPVLVAAWALAEYFAGRRRLLLPSMVLAVTICASAGAIASALLIPTERPGDGFDLPNFAASIGYAGFGAAAVAALAVHLRFRLAFALFLFAICAAGLVYTAIAHLGQGNQISGGLATLLIGILTLLAAIWFDSLDPTRSSLTSDRAFWLHMAAAPQIILGVRALVLGSGFAPAGPADAFAMLAVLVAFGVLSLALNRRALIVSGLISFVTAIGVIVNQVAGGGAGGVVLTLLVVGGSIVLLGGGWRTARRFVLRLIPQTEGARRIFPPEPA